MTAGRGYHLGRAVESKETVEENRHATVTTGNPLP
jgi:hypothetical protein